MGDGQLEALAERAAAGDSAALSRLVEEVQHPIHGLALRFLGHPEDAKDATQEILVRLITHLRQFEGRSKFMTWAYTIAVRQLMRTRKRQLESAVKGADAFAAALDEGPPIATSPPRRPSTGCCPPRCGSAAPTRCSCACRGRCARPTSSATRWACPTSSPRRSAVSRGPPSASGLPAPAARRAQSSPRAAASSTPPTRAAAPARSKAGSTPEPSTATTWPSRRIPEPTAARSRPARSSEQLDLALAMSEVYRSDPHFAAPHEVWERLRAACPELLA
jgi:RNA polymerase sigma factor (sigma-70 family)